MRFDEYWRGLSPELRQFMIERVGISQPYVSLLVNGRRRPSKQMREMIELIAGQQFIWEMTGDGDRDEYSTEA